MLRRSFLASAAACWARTPSTEVAKQFLALVKKHGVDHAVMVHNSVTLGSSGTRSDAVFLLASITKPMTAAAVMTLVDQKLVRLDDPARRYLPEFSSGDRARITVRQLLSHTSGLPDMLPENDALRQRHAPLQEFVKLACQTPLLFQPGRECRYQSMGILLAAEIVQRVTKQPLPAYLKEQLFGPLHMNHTSLGLGGRAVGDTVRSQLAGQADWDWNSAYWRGLGAPWGGALAPAADVERFLRVFLEPEKQKILKPESARAMVTDQNVGLNKAWGIGWAVNARPEAGLFGSGCSARAFGHGGSTGTLCWADPASGTVFVLLTGKPAAESNKPVLHPLSNLASM